MPTIALKGPGLRDWFSEQLVKDCGPELARERCCGPALAAVNRAIARLEAEKECSSPVAVAEVAPAPLLPCPFCGNADSPTLRKTETLEHIEQSIFTGGFMVICDASSWNGKHGCGASSGWSETETEAVADWNRRDTPGLQKQGDRNVD